MTIKAVSVDPILGAGRELFSPRLPVERADLCLFAALERWLELVCQDGPVFRTFDLRW